MKSIGRYTPTRKTSPCLGTNNSEGCLNHSSICWGTGLQRGEQDGSWCQHEFASVVCLRGRRKNTAISLSRCTERLPSVIRRCGWLTRLSVVSTETLFFPFPCFPTSRLLHVFLNRKWDMSDEKLTKIWPTPIENSGFCDRICYIPHLFHRKFICKIVFLFMILFVDYFVYFCTNNKNKQNYRYRVNCARDTSLYISANRRTFLIEVKSQKILN